jgi:NADH:ubiquinone oxidoreductase subunit 5 (subunit L)/multisubunit Na+/H+ antiporter MnhA subunit/multisubunit Na+/H+ antiporter MnhB subunit
MEVVLLNIIPFIVALLFCLSPVRMILKTTGMAVVTALTMTFLFFSFASYLSQVTQGESLVTIYEWMDSLGFTLVWNLDSLSLMFTLIVTGVGIAVFLYAGFYMDDPDELGRFYVYLLAFSGAMLALVMAGNIFMLFIAWEATSILSFMLIGFKGDKYEDARTAASRALVITGGGGLALIAGLMLLGVATNQANGLDQFASAGFQLDLILSTDITAHGWYIPIVVLVLLGAFTKSAQFPFHFWLPGGMTAPSPASAYLHSATMVKAGVYLLYRLYPTLGGDWLWINSLLIVGLTTMLMGSFFALRQRDLKGLLAYSTISKLGAIVALIGLPNGYGLKAAAISIIAHALYKATFFLMAGIVEHSTGTRNLDQLGGLARRMPLALWISILVALSMAGVPPLIGFAAKEFLLDEFLRAPYISVIPVIIAFIASLFTAIASLYFVWDTFFSAPKQDYKHFHSPSPMIYAGPALLALMSLLMGIFITPLLTDLTIGVIGKETEVYIIPHDLNPLTNAAFGLSLLVLIGGAILFAYRQVWIDYAKINLPSGQTIYANIIRSWEWLGDQFLKAQTGNIRHYLLVILIVVGFMMIFVNNYSIRNIDFMPTTAVDLLRVILLALTIGSAWVSILAKRHLLATLSLGIAGYVIGGLFLLEPGPDVALVQILVETLTAVLLILIVARIDVVKRRNIINISKYDISKFHILFDVAVASFIGLNVGLFALDAVQDRDSRLNTLQQIQDVSMVHVEDDLTHLEQDLHINITRPIVLWHMENAYPQTGAQDVIASILADFRGTDTLLEITVFATAALGVLTILMRPRDRKTEVISAHVEIPSATVAEDDVELEPLLDPDAHTKDDEAFIRGNAYRQVQDFSTPLTRFSAKIILPIAFLISLTHIFYGGSQPGDGFTAGIVSGLAVALWFVVFGYETTYQRLKWLHPIRLIILGLIIAVFTGLLGLLTPSGAFFAGIDGGNTIGGVHLSTALLFEAAIFLTVFGGATTIMTAIAHPEALIEDISNE